MDHKQRARVRWERSWDVYTLEQKRVITRFLEFMALGAGQRGQDSYLPDLAENAWKSYWFKFSNPD